MVQPPADAELGQAALCHYTWGAIFKDTLQQDKEVWKFDKRFYTAKADALKVLRIHPIV
jgi:hydroxyproline O-arabinosyltransferase